MISLKLVSHARIFLRKGLQQKIRKAAYVKKLRKRSYESLCSHVRKTLRKNMFLRLKISRFFFKDGSLQ